MSPYVVPDHVLERNLPTPLTPTFWGDLTIVSFDALDPPQTSVFPESHVPARLSASSKESEDTSTPQAKLADLLDVQHPRLFFDDGNIMFRVQGILYRVHRYLFCESSEFKHRLSGLSTQEESSSCPPTIPLDDVKSVDFDAFLSILYPQNYNTLEERSFNQWSSILDLSTRWGFTSVRNLAIRCIKPPNSLNRLLLARKHGVEQWILPALLELCQRPEPLSIEEARLMDFEDVVLVGSVRQTVRSPTLTVRGAEIRNCIRAWKRGEPWSSVPDPPDTAFFGPFGQLPASQQKTIPSAPIGEIPTAIKETLPPTEAAHPPTEEAHPPGTHDLWGFGTKKKGKNRGASRP